jgi:lactate dehydrogenase-like 2-hydroxyacid dehydrogenase|tara:strand:- start:828 stop:950 length:123 start_codon:yes stop_codon:yes gene_type:complete
MLVLDRKWVKKMTTPPIQNIAVIGLGTIGHSVAQVYVATG